MQGPNGLYNPNSAMYVNCKKDKELCEVFQQGDPSDLPCTKEKKFKCFFTHEYGDGLRVKGAIIETPVTFALQDESRASTTMAVGSVILSSPCSHSRLPNNPHYAKDLSSTLVLFHVK